MGLPAFASTGLLPLGRHACELDEFEQVFVLDDTFATSQTRSAIFADFLAALAYLKSKYHVDLIERVWVGGGFTSSKLDPADIDVTFLLNDAAHEALSNTSRGKLSKILRLGGFKELGLSVDGFMLVREPVANPWHKAGLGADGADYFPLRGAWDDWWSRDRGHVAAGDEPVLEDAHPVRGYVEVVV